jgi:hypothetical protein
LRSFVSNNIIHLATLIVAIVVCTELMSQCKQQVTGDAKKWLSSIGKLLERAALLAETVGLVCAMLGACHALLKTRWSQTGKQHKKKVSATVVRTTLNAFFADVILLPADV